MFKAKRCMKCKEYCAYTINGQCPHCFFYPKDVEDLPQVQRILVEEKVAKANRRNNR
jgi:hypothetical protein